MSEHIMLREIGLPTYEQVHIWLTGRGWAVEKRAARKDRVVYHKPGLRPRVWTCTTTDWGDYDQVILDLVDGVAKAERLPSLRLQMVREILGRDGRANALEEARRAMAKAIDLLDEHIGDTDIDDDDRPAFRAMRVLVDAVDDLAEAGGRLECRQASF